MFKGIKTIQGARNRVNTLVSKLKSCFLLIDGYDEKHVKMHDVVRDMALWMQSDAFMVTCDDDFSSWTNADSSQHYSRVSVHCREINELLKLSISSNLEFLMVSKTGYWGTQLDAPYNIFEGMSGLKVLEIFGFLSSSPSWMCSLTNLQTLSLCSSKVESLCTISKLRNLEILHLYDLDMIKELPSEFRDLANLKELSIIDCVNLERIPPGIIASLVHLEELYMIRSFVNWEAGEEEETRNASIIELSSLSHLTTLEIVVKDPLVLAADIHFRSNLARYKIISDSELYEEVADINKVICLCFDKAICLSLNTGTPLFGRWILDLLPGAEGLHVYADSDVEDQSMFWSCGTLESLMASESIVQDMPSLGFFSNIVQLVLSSLYNLKEICPGPVSHDSYRQLKILGLEDLPKLAHLWRSPSHSICLPNLRIVYIKNCSSLRNLFSLSTARSLSQLEVLNISSCECMVEVFQEEEEEEEGACESHMIEFPKLESLFLVNLPNLETFCKGVNDIRWPLLSSVRIEHLPQFQSLIPGILKTKKKKSLIPKESDVVWQEEQGMTLRLFEQKAPVPNITELSYGGPWKWNRPPSVGIISRLAELVFKGNDNLEYLFTSAANFPVLKYLDVRECSRLQEIIRKEEEEGEDQEGGVRTLSFPSLSYLTIADCRCLEYLFTSPSYFPLLRELSVIDCSRLQEIIRKEEEEGEDQERGVRTLSFPKLEFITLLRLPNLSAISNHTLQFPTLSDFRIEDCPCMENLFTSASNFPLLHKLKVRYCSRLQEIIRKEEEGGEDQEGGVRTLSFPKLRFIELLRLPNLSSFSQSKYALQFPSLSYFTIEDCPCLEKFAAGSPDFLKKLDVKLGGIIPFHELTTGILSRIHELELNSIHNVVNTCSLPQ